MDSSVFTLIALKAFFASRAADSTHDHPLRYANPTVTTIHAQRHLAARSGFWAPEWALAMCPQSHAALGGHKSPAMQLHTPVLRRTTQ